MTILAAQLVIPALPYLLSFAAGAMLYVVVEELIPEMSQGRHSNLGTVFFAVGFSVMMAPSGKFWMAMPRDRASALAAVICALPARKPAYITPTAMPSGMFAGSLPAPSS